MVGVLVGVKVDLAVLVGKRDVCVDFAALVEVTFGVGEDMTDDFSLVEAEDVKTAACVLMPRLLHADNNKIPARLKQSKNK